MGRLTNVALISATLLLAAVRAGESAPITFTFEGRVTGVAAGSPISVDDVFSGSFTYDPDGGPTRTRPGEALFDDSLIGLTFTLGGWHGSASAPSAIGPPASPLGLVYDVPFGSDLLFVQDFFDVSTPFMGHSLSTLFLILGDTSRSAFSSATLPDALDLAAFDLREVSFAWEGRFEGDTGLITRLERTDVAVPEPSLIALACAAGLAGLGRQRRRRTRGHQIR